MALTLTSPDFEPNGEIPSRFTCEGEDVSPSLAWTGVPAAARSLALIVDDPGAPDPRAPKTVWVHWVLYNLPPTALGLPQGGELPLGTLEGLNDWKKTGWGGPCPPTGRTDTSSSSMPWTPSSPICAIPPRSSSRRPWRGTCSPGPSW